MSPLKRFLSHFGSSTVAALQSFGFRKLPPEIVQRITNFLPVVFAAIFSVTCRPLNYLVGIQYLQALRSDGLGPEHYELLCLLARDLPNHVACYYCMHHHAIEHTKPCLYTQRYSKQIYSGFPDLHCLAMKTEESNVCIHYNFSISVFHLAMQVYRQGGNCIVLLDLASEKPKTHFLKRRECAVYWASWPRIVSGPLFARQQTIYLITVGKPISSYHGFKVCAHDWWATIQSETGIGRLPQHRQVCWQQRRYPSIGLMRCEYCYTEYLIDFKMVGNLKAIYSKMWKDLGLGVSMLVEAWRSYLFKSFSTVPSQQVPLRPIAAAYEHSTDLQYFQFDC